MSTPAALPPTTVEALRDELARVKAQLAEYVGHEPTIREEMQHLSEQNDLLRRVVAQHVADSYASGNDTVEGLARSLVTELDAAGIDISREVRAITGEGVAS